MQSGLTKQSIIFPELRQQDDNTPEKKLTIYNSHQTA